MVQRPRKLVAAVSVNRLEKSEHDPDVHCQDVQVFRHRAPEDWDADRTKCEDHRFDGGGIFGGEAEGSGVLMVELVDLFVEGWCVQGAVEPVVPCVFEDEEDGDLVGHCQ